MWLFFIFVAVPIIEIALFIQLGGWLGLFPTLGIVILTAAIGTILVRSQGLAALGDIQNGLRGGGNPVTALAHGALILASGLLLLTPGFFTDAVGFSLLVPPVREVVIRYLSRRITVKTAFNDANQPQSNPDTIDAEFEVVDDETSSQNPGNSGWTQRP